MKNILKHQEELIKVIKANSSESLAKIIKDNDLSLKDLINSIDSFELGKDSL